ncbi:hypothetical protein GCM10011512_01400 [Tersicoccus solisilvae]|uniref:Phosphatidic acid phosphatase type 2/haloperoxidase domain-containing protein n=1 Tax=Tersicoccus solisilvae TaxID=1882339 RepID=A0ABQ1NM33_9MICC|nr:phosphatase PAP2 family protein [Tersicoccus solisilvae]GGC78567.1 hypothetical protein GCM10011512_01400 [Tersicoccus solisilvae]
MPDLPGRAASGPVAATPHTAVDRIARAASEVLAPPFLASLLMAIAALASGVSGRTVLAAAVAIGFTIVAPMAVIVVLARRGRLSGHYVPERTERTPVYVGTLVSGGVGMVLLVLLRAPHALFVVMGGIATGLVAVLLVNLWWKISAHTAVAASVAVTLAGWLGGPWWMMLTVPVVVGWSRVRMRVHTRGQVIVGGLLGVAVALVWLPLLR